MTRPLPRSKALLFSLVPDLYITGLVVLPGAVLYLLLYATGLLARAGRTGLLDATLVVAVPALLMLAWLVALRPRARNDSGLVLTRLASPTMHTLVDSVRSRARAPEIGGILLGTSFAVSVVRAPRSLLPGARRYVVIGLPLLFALTRAQFRALLAHEFAHVSRARGIRGVHIWRVRDRWMRWTSALEAKPRFATFILRPFFRWYTPRLASHTAALARDHEFAADRHAARATKREDLAAGLLRIAVIQQLLNERFYPRLLADVRRCGVTPSGLQSRFEIAIRDMSSDPRFAAWLDTALHGKDARDVAHPPLRDRLGRLGISEARTAAGVDFLKRAFPDTDSESAAHHCLAEVPPALILSIEKLWIDEVQREWHDRHEELLRLDMRRRELDQKSRLTPSEALEHVISTAETEGTLAALQPARDLAGCRPDMPRARFVLGTLLLRNNDPEGLEHMRLAMAQDPELEPAARQLVRAFLRANGRHEAAWELNGNRNTISVEHPPACPIDA